MAHVGQLATEKEAPVAAAENVKHETLEYTAVAVWDVPTRVLHWLNALTIISLVIFALTMEGVESLALSEDAQGLVKDLLKQLHTYAGYFLAVTYTCRVIWGFVGNRHARFGDMISFKREHWAAIGENIRWYLGGFKGHPPVSIGHNPLASLFYLPLFVVLGLQVITGIILAGLEYEVFPGTIISSLWGAEGVDAWGEAAEEVHEFGLYFILFFFCCHMAGLVLHEIGERSGLLSAMVHGKKYFPKGTINKD